MKKNKMMRLASFLLVATLLTTSMISGTFAKYVSTATGTDSARVAKWDIEVEGNKITANGSAQNVTFDLFKSVNDFGAGTDDAEVKNGKIIAPGTSGSFMIDIANKSEVDAKYTINLTESNPSNIPIQYSVDGTNWKDSVAELVMTDLTDVKIAMETGTDTKTIQWRWAYEGDTDAHVGQTDVTDTALGLAGTAEVTIAAEIIVVQVD